MELKRINVLVPDDLYYVLVDYQRKMGFRTRDKAMAEMLRVFKEKCMN